MKCEIFVREHLPSIRAVLSTHLINSGLTQQEAADRLYLSQAAVALYKKQVRGKKVKELEEKPEVKKRLEELAGILLSKSLMEGELDREYCDLCRLILGQ